MGCYPLRVIVSKALGKCNGRERWMEDQRMDYAMAYPPDAPTQTHYMHPVARTVTFSATNSVHIIPPNNTPPPQQQQQQPEPQAPPPQQHEPDHQPQPEQPAPAPAPAPEQGAPPAEQQPKRKKKSSRRVRFGPEPPPPQQQQQQDHQQQHQEQQQQQQHQPAEHAPNNNPAGSGQQVHGPPPWYSRYTPSPLPRWEATPRRHEYFSGEYRYSYPTPVREGIYSMATDANRLTTIFSEENPNACAIV